MLVSPAMADGRWSGDWTVRWANGAAVLTLAQNGLTVSGSYRTGHGHVEATAHGTRLDGYLIDLGEREGFTATLAPDSRSFSGHTNAGDWLLGITVLAPVAHDSGTLRGKRAIAGGRRALRHVMFQAALVAAHHNPSLRSFADRLRKAGKPHKVIITAVARKLVTIANALCKNRQKWAVPTT